jgi:hypothetical protein
MLFVSATLVSPMADIEFASQRFQDVGVGGRPQHLDRHPLFPRVRPAAEADHTLAALAQPAEQLEAAQARGIAWLQGLRRHGARLPVPRGPGLASRLDTAMLGS